MDDLNQAPDPNTVAELQEGVEAMEEVNPYDPAVAVNPFAEKEAELSQEELYGTGIPHCENPDCNKPLRMTGGLRKTCNKQCRKAARNARHRARRQARRSGAKTNIPEPQGTGSQASGDGP